MKLLVEQMRHQSPTDPADGQAWINQMTQFSMLEQMQQQSAGQVKANAAGYLGKTVSWHDAKGQSGQGRRRAGRLHRHRAHPDRRRPCRREGRRSPATSHDAPVAQPRARAARSARRLPSLRRRRRAPVAPRRPTARPSPTSSARRRAQSSSAVTPRRASSAAGSHSIPRPSAACRTVSTAPLPRAHGSPSSSWTTWPSSCPSRPGPSSRRSIAPPCAITSSPTSIPPFSPKPTKPPTTGWTSLEEAGVPERKFLS